MNAFPTMQYVNGISPSGFDPGMTLRDYFASAALAASLEAIKNYYGIDKKDLANYCYQVADEMMKARNNHG